MTEHVSLTSTSIPEPEAQPRQHTTRRSWLRRLGLLAAILIILLDLANLTILGLKALDRPGAAPSGALLYATTFDAYNDEWQQFDGQLSAKVSDGSLHIKIGAAGQG